MNPFSRHPGLKRLTRLAEDRVSEAEARRLRGHLRECQRCRADLAFFRDVREVARQISHPSPPRNTLQEILERREAGERVILPTSTPPARRLSPGIAVPLLLLVALAALVATLVVGAGEASAGASSLRIGPVAPELGESLRVEFRAASPLAGEERVILRARYRTEADGPALGEDLGSPFRQELSRNGDAAFTGTLRLPPSAVYALFVVEDVEGERIETDAGRPWEVMAYDEAGRPLFAALEQRFRAMEAMGRPDEMRATALRMTELYPDEPVGWELRLAVEVALSGPEDAARVAESHRARLVRLEQMVSRLDQPGGARLAALARYASRLGEDEAARRWTRRLLEEYPHHPLAQRERVMSIVAASRATSSDPGEHLRAFELEWDRAGPMDISLLHAASHAAQLAGDPAAVQRWADRMDRFDPEEAVAIAARSVEAPEYRDWAMERLRRALFQLGTSMPDGRPLLATRAEHRRTIANMERVVLARLGVGLVAERRLGAALDTLALAAEGSWDPGLFRELAALRIAAGDTTGGLRLYGMAAADPLAARGLREEAVAVTEALDEGAWHRLVERGRRELERRIAAGPARRPEWGEGARVLDVAGREVTLESLTAGHTNLLAFWVAGAEELASLQQRADRLASAGVQALALWDGQAPTGPAAASPIRALGDVRREASHTFTTWVRPWYVVLDDRGLVRYEGTDVEDAFRHAVVLAAEGRMPS